MTEEPPPPRAPAHRGPFVLFPPPADAPPQGAPPREPLLDRWRPRTRAEGAPDRERFLVVLESLLPEGQAALDRLLDEERAQGAQLLAHWAIAAKDRGSNTTEVTFVPQGRGADPTLLASGTFGETAVEIELALAHATPDEDARLKQAMARAATFTMLLLSHEVDSP